MAKYSVVALSALIAMSSVRAQGAQCGGTFGNCPKASPCCSEYGFCGDKAFCLGGCNPFWSHASDSCKPMAACEPATYTFPDLTSLVKHVDYDGNSTAHAWTIDEGEPLNTNSNGGELALVLTEGGKGTRISTTKYLHYGKVTASVRVSKWPGVVTAFITMSDIKDEIDWEWPGPNTSEAQSNFFFMGKVAYGPGSNGGVHGDLTDTYANFHDYTIDWQPDTLKFLIDGQEVRSINKADTLINGRYEYPTTPSRIQLSIWPAGLPEAPKGTVEWAGGMIDWTNADYVAYGNKYVALVNKVTVQCDDALTIKADTVSYRYGANDTNGIPNVFASNQTSLLNAAVPAHKAMQLWSLGAIVGSAVVGIFLF